MKTKARITVVVTALGIAIIAYGFAAMKTEKIVPENGFALVELYTSEGCSSCPPADALVAKILAEDKDKPVYVLGYHVDYWNRLGWKDVYSKPEFSKRQREYAGLLHSQVYTPQIVVNGETAFVGSDNNALRKAISKNLTETTTEQLLLTGKSSGENNLTISYQLKGVSENQTLYLALVKKAAISEVKSGENSGRELKHVNIVESLQKVPLKNLNGSVNIALNHNKMDNTEVIGFIQDARSGQIKAAAKCILAAL